jgi:cation-dependent mannose-6-phosphate receptor
MRGKKLVLNYTDGSPCEPATKRGYARSSLDGRAIVDDDDDEDTKKPSKGDGSDTKKPSRPSTGGRRKNTIISMLCDQDPLAPQLQLSFIGSPDECTYIFEGRSPAACASQAKKPEAVGPASVFGIVALIAVLVYLVGGCVYSRVVLQQRGWRQLPNYDLWAGLFNFFNVSVFYACVLAPLFNMLMRSPRRTSSSS